MARTNAAAVQAILGGTATGSNWNGTTSVDPFIATATVIVDRVETCAIADESPLTAAELELVERWLAAHCYQQFDKGYTQRSTLSASGSFEGQTGMYLESTRYGQMAMAVDPSGCLRAQNAGGRTVATAVWLGKPPSEQVNVWDRE